MSMPSLSLEGKVVLITGARRGLGRAIALAFAEAGADVAVCDIAVEGGEMEAVVEEIKKLGQRSLAVQTDVTQRAQVDNLVQRVEDELGAIDILVNDAGVVVKASLLEYSEEDWDKVIDTNLKGCYLCCHAVGRRMVERKKGNIINMASTAAMTAREKLGAYSISKAGVAMLTRVLARELARHNIRVNAIAPGVVRTAINEWLWRDPVVLKQWETEIIPLGRLGEPSDIANVALFLASDASKHITGDIILVDGGQLA